MACLANIEKNFTYQGRPEGAIRKCHRLSVRSDYLERCERFQPAVECHQVASEALQAYLKTQISVASRRQVELLIRRHQTRIFYLRRREEERKHEPSSPQLLSASFSEAGDENARLYFSHSPAMLQEVKKCQVQFINAIEQLHSLVNPEDLTKQIEASDLMRAEDKAMAKTEKSSCQDNASCSKDMSAKTETTDVDSSVLTTTEAPPSSGSDTHCPASDGCPAQQSSSGGACCKQCGKSFEERLREEECMLRLAGDLPAVWRAKDRTLLGVLADYSRMAKARDTLQDQVKQLTFQLEQVRSQAEQQSQLMSCSNITYNTTDPDPGDLTTSDTQDPHGDVGGYLGVLGGAAHNSSTCSVNTSEFHHVLPHVSGSTLTSGYSYGGSSVTVLDHPQQSMAGGGVTSLTSSGYDQITSAMEKMACASKASSSSSVHPFGGGTPVKPGAVFESLERRGVGFTGFGSRVDVPRNGDLSTSDLPKLEPSSSFSVAEQDFPPLNPRRRNDGR